MARTNNPNGRPTIAKAKSQELRDAITYVESLPSGDMPAKTNKRVPLFVHAVLECYKDNTLLAQILRKLLPDLKAIDIKATQDSPFRLIIDVTPQRKPGKAKNKRSKS